MRKQIVKKHNLNPNDFKLDEIVSIELIGDKPTIDIEVEDTHMFFANDIYTHNSSEDEDIITASNVADSYRKIMTADFVMSLSRKIEDKVSNTARFHVIKNRFGADGITLPSIFNANNGSITLYDQSSKEGMELQSKMGDGENVIKKMLSNKWQQHSAKNEEIIDADSV
jgi:hypothetical protein